MYYIMTSICLHLILNYSSQSRVLIILASYLPVAVDQVTVDVHVFDILFFLRISQYNNNILPSGELYVMERFQAVMEHFTQ